MADEPSEGEKASQREGHAWGCGAQVLGCGVDAAIVLVLLPLAASDFLR